MSHLSSVWTWKELSDLQICDLKGLRFVHALNLFVFRGGIWIKWKQYMSSESWSTPVCLVLASQVARIAAFRPSRRAQHFEDASAMLSWLDRFETSLVGASNVLNTRREDIDWLRSVIRRNAPFTHGPDIEEVIRRLCGVGRSSSTLLPPANEHIPMDQIVLLFPGADQPALPVDTLLRLSGHPGAPPPPLPFVGPGSLVIVKSSAEFSHGGLTIPF